MRTEVKLSSCIGKTYEGAAWSLGENYMVLLFSEGLFTTLKTVSERDCPDSIAEATFDIADFDEHSLINAGWADAVEVRRLKQEARDAYEIKNQLWRDQQDAAEYIRLKRKFEGA